MRGDRVPKSNITFALICLVLALTTTGYAGSLRIQEENYGKLPLSFEANRGQVDPQVRFVSRGSRYALFLLPTEVVMALRTSQEKHTTVDGRSRTEPAWTTKANATMLRMQLVGANPSPWVTGLETLPGKSHYFIGNDPTKWRTHIPHYGKVGYVDVYPGVDLVYYGNQRQLEYDFVVAPGADPRIITLGFEGADKLEIDAQRNLILHTTGGKVIQHAPVIYQEINGVKQPISGGYVLLEKDQVGFQVAAYDPSEPLIIDPVVLSYSTYLGGSDLDQGEGIAVDRTGNAYVTGSTASIDFPIANGLQPESGGSVDIFVTKLSPTGDALVYSTYLGGVFGDNSFGIAVGRGGNAYVTGRTLSNDFPTTATALQPDFGGGSSDAFVAKLGANGDALVFSTYLGGSGSDPGYGIAVDRRGNVYVTGGTGSTDFPTVNAVQPDFGGGSSDAFVAKLGANGDALVFSTYLGGGDYDTGLDVALDYKGNAYVTGQTGSTDFPTVNPVQSALNGPTDAFVANVDRRGNTLLYSTYLGGSDYDTGFDVAVDRKCNASIAGATTSTDFPTVNAVQPDFGGSLEDAFVAKLGANGDAFVFSTYLGGSGSEGGYGITVDRRGNVYVILNTGSPDLVTVFPLQPALNGNSDAYVAELSANGDAFVFSTYLGGSESEDVNDIALDVRNNVYVTGSTVSEDFPTVNPFQPEFGGGISPGDAFVAKIAPDFVQIDRCQTGAENQVVDAGSTIADLVMACAEDAANHGEFVSCVADLTNDLEKDGIINGQEKDAIKSCAAQANVP